MDRHPDQVRKCQNRTDNSMMKRIEYSTVERVG
jgi:hypothetical protein